MEEVRMAVAQDIVIELTISEPPDVYQVLKGKIVRPIKLLGEEELYYLFQDESSKWLLIKPRYIDEQIEEVYLGKRVHVVIAALIDQSAINSDFFQLDQVNYFGIGTITKL
jgi:hypothetical protein